jgi:hypothetical protein
MLPSEREGHHEPGASETALNSLRTEAHSSLPSEYFALLAQSNGGEGPLAVSPFNFCLFSAEEATSLKADGTYGEFFPGFFMFGSSGGGEYIGFDLRATEPWPIVAIDMTNIELSESVEVIANEFNEFLSLIGIRADA